MTAREYWMDTRGLDTATVDEKLLGWAPPDARDELLDHLHRNGHDCEDILASELFNDDLDPLWRGRYVLPYFDEDGRVAYTISRTTGCEGGGAVGYGGHPADVMRGSARSSPTPRSTSTSTNPSMDWSLLRTVRTSSSPRASSTPSRPTRPVTPAPRRSPLNLSTAAGGTTHYPRRTRCRHGLHRPRRRDAVDRHRRKC